MKFGELNIKNFLTIGEAKVNLADRGLVLIQGVNEDDSSASSNGAGKSSVVDALCWTLFGSTARGVSGDSVVNRSAGKECAVAIEIIDDDGTVYIVTRHRKHRTGKNGVELICWDGKSVAPRIENDLTQGTDKLTQEKINEVLGCSYEVFCAAVYAGQDQMPDLPGMTDKALKLLVEEAAGVTILEAAYDQARSRLSEVKVQLDTARHKIGLAESQVTMAQEQAGSLRNSALEWDGKRSTQLADLRSLIKQHDENVETTKATYEGFNVPKIEADLAAVVTKLAAVAGERDTEKAILAEQTASERTVATMKANLQTLRDRYASEKTAAEGVDKLVGTPCTECGKDYCAHDVEGAKTLAVKKASTTAREFKTLKFKTESAIAALESVTQRLVTHRASMTDISASTSLSDALNAKLREAEKARQAYVHEQRSRKATVDRELELVAQDNPFEKQIIQADQRVDQRIKDLDAAKSGVEDLEKKQQVAELVAKVFSPAGVRAHILDDVTPFLNDQTAKYLGTLSDGNITATWTTLVKNAKGELKEKFSIEVNHAEGGESFDGISGGEKRKVRIATALALQDLVARRATKPIDLFIGDEIDNALDDPGLERLTAILEEKAKERGTVLVISHSDLKDWISNVITVTKKSKVSTVEEATV